MGISGSQRAYSMAQGGVMRGSSSRGNVHSMFVFVAIDGVQYGTARANDDEQVDNETLSISETEGETPNTASFQTRGFQPTDGQDVVITQGSINNLHRLFAGTVMTDTRRSVGTPANGRDQVNVIDYTWQLTRGTISRRWTNVSGTVIAQEIIADLDRGFSSEYVEANLPVIDEFTVTNQTHASALGQLCNRLGASYWIATYYRTIWLGLGSDPNETNPTELTEASAKLTEMTDLVVTRDLSQVITRQPVEGGGSNAATEVSPGETILPVEDDAFYNLNGGTVVSGPQRIDYTGLQTGGAGSVVGPSVSPSSAPTLVTANGAGVETGAHSYAYTFGTASGESLPSPLRAITLGPTTPPSTAPSPTLDLGLGPDAGVHRWAYTFVNSAGETTASPVSADVTTTSTPVADPLVTASLYQILNAGSGGHLGTGVYSWAVTYADVNGGETLAGPLLTFNNTLVALGFAEAELVLPAPPFNTTLKLYRTVSGGGTLKLVANLGAWIAGVHYIDGTPDGSLGATAPVSNTCQDIRRRVLLSIDRGDGATTSRKIYRTAAGGSQLKLAFTVGDNSSTVVADSIADSGLGADVPVSNTASANRVSLSGIALGPTGTTSRKVYRTAVGSSQLKLQQTIANNSATTGVVDSTPDGSLGANVPVSDTSGLSTVNGQVNAGSTTILTSGPAPFDAAGGWVVSGQQVIRYTGVSGNSLTGIPASGSGAIISTLVYGDHIDPLPALTGIPASGDGAILYSIHQGDAVNLRVVVDDLAARAVIATLLDDDGIIEGAVIQDGRISETEALARGEAQLALRKEIAVTAGYTTHDINTHASREISFDNDQLEGTLRLQSVTIDNFHPSRWQTHKAQASSKRFSLEMLLRLARSTP